MKRRADEFMPKNEQADAVEFLELIKEVSLEDFLDRDCCATPTEANCEIMNIVTYYNNLIQEVLTGGNIPDILKRAVKNESRQKR